MSEQKKKEENFDAMLRLMWGEDNIPYHEQLAKIVWLYVDILDVLGQGRENNIPLDQVKKWLDNSHCSAVITTLPLNLNRDFTVNGRPYSFFNAPTTIVRNARNWGDVYFNWDPQTSLIDCPTYIYYSDNRIRKCVWKKKTKYGFVTYRPGDKPAQIDIDIDGAVCMEWHDEDGYIARLSRPWLSVFRYNKYPKQDGKWIRYSSTPYELNTVIWSPSERIKGLFVNGMTFEQSVDKWIQPELDKLQTYVHPDIRKNNAWQKDNVVSLVHLMFGWPQPSQPAK